MFMQRTQQENQGASQAKNWNQLEQTPIINYDALGTAALINSALAADVLTGAGAEADMKAVLQSMQKLAAKLSYNTLVPWLQGACLLVGDRADCEAVFTNPNPGPGGDAKKFYNTMWTGDQMTEWLRALRRSNGNDWDASLSAAAFLEAKKLSLQREEIFSSLPPVTHADSMAGVVGWNRA